MKTSHQIQPINTVALKQVALKSSLETRGVMTLGHQRNWNFVVLGRAPMPDEPVRLGEWLIIPAHQDSSLIPVRTQQRVQAIFAAGLRPKGFVLVHEAPYILPAPSQTGPDIQRTISMPDVTPTLTAAINALGILGKVAVITSGVAALSVAAVFLTSILAIPAALAIGAIVLDPILIAVTEDNYWIEIDRWQN